MSHFRNFTAILAGSVLAAAVHAQPAGPVKTVIDGKTPGLELKPSSAQVTAATSPEGISVTIQPGDEGYPGLSIARQDGKPFDLSAHGHVEAKVTNTSAKPLGLNLRLDNAGDWKTNPYNAESTFLKPGESGTVKLIFGYSYGKKKGFPLKSDGITRIMFFTGKSDAPQTFRIDSVAAGGSPGEELPVDPATIRTRPKDGLIFTPATRLNAGKQLDLKNGVTATMTPKGLRLAFPGGGHTGQAGITPELGRWDLSQTLQVVLKITNDGTTAVAPKIRLESNGGPSDSISVEPIAPGASTLVTVPFASRKPWVGDGEAGKKGGAGNSMPSPGSKVTSDAVSAVIIAVENIDSPRSLVVEGIKANLPPPPVLPAWLGKRPPVEGDWTLTFEDNFNGKAVDEGNWNVHAPNYWDKATAFSKANVIVDGGVARLRYEKKTGFHNDDPKQKQFGYTTGFLDTYGKWVQRYGYYETRTKLPTSPGLWPAFWLMPDRGVEAGEQWQRQDTGKGGMEYDIVEHLTRWGPYRYNIAMHWDGYGKEHKAIGSSNIYVQPDKDGYVTSGMLWLPGSVVFYYNGTEVARWETERISAIPSHLMYTLPQGGWDNNEVDDKQLPADFLIDYVRVWQRKDLASPADGPKAPPADP